MKEDIRKNKREKSWELLQELGNIEDDLVKGAAQETRAAQENRVMQETRAVRQKPIRNRRLLLMRMGAAAAILCLMAGTAVLSARLLFPQNAEMENPFATENIAASIDSGSEGVASVHPKSENIHGEDLENGNENTQEGTEDLEEAPVKITDLIAREDTSAEGNVISKEDLKYKIIPVNGQTAEYHEVAVGTGKDGLLADSLGELLEGTDCYRLKGHDELQYLLTKEEEEYSLWEFAVFETVPYDYSMVLKDIYGVDSAQDIASVTVSPAKMDNSDAGKKLQNQIGTRVITDAGDIASIYQALSGMVCLGANRWDEIDLGGDDSNLREAVSEGRYLTISLVSGNEIGGLKYTARSGQFYEFGGIAYQALGGPAADSVEKALGYASDQWKREDGWLTAQEINERHAEKDPASGTVGGYYVRSFIAYQGGFYRGCSGEELLEQYFIPAKRNVNYSSVWELETYCAAEREDLIAVYLNGGLQGYRKIADVIFEIDGAAYGINREASENEVSGHGEAVLEGENFTVYQLRTEKVQQGQQDGQGQQDDQEQKDGEGQQESSRVSGSTPEYLVNILPILCRECPNLFQEGGNYVESWCIAVPIE